MDTTSVVTNGMSDFYSGLLSGVLLAIVGGLVAFYFYKQRRKIERKDKKTDAKTGNQAAACKSVWKLIPYLEVHENQQSILVQRGTHEKTVNYVNFKNAAAFINAVEQVRSDQEHGIYLPTDVNEVLGNIRKRMYQFIESISHKEAKQAGIDISVYFSENGGFLEAAGQREDALVKQKNPKWRADYRQEVEQLKMSCKRYM
ncbi:MAG: hypothetical protein AAGI23_18945 [Bacteroidota bacterium]